MAGASLAYELSAQNQSVLVLESESCPAYHTTGRSAAFYMEAYGNDTVRKITQASRHFFDHPPEQFCEVPLLKPCGALYIADQTQEKKLRELHKTLSQHIKGCELVDQQFIRQKIPSINTEKITIGFWEPESMEIDVAALMAGYIRLAKKNHVQFLYNTQVKKLQRHKAMWHINDTFQAKTVVNAGGAWADELIQLAGGKPLQLKPKKRTICVVKPAQHLQVKNWPLTLDIDEQFYFKPEGNNLLITPADEIDTHPHDVQAEEYDVALGIDRVQQVVNLPVTQVIRRWAGLRTFSADKSPVIGYDNDIENFFWLAGQGGYGIQMAPALAKLAANLALGKQDILETMKLSYESITPGRFDS